MRLVLTALVVLFLDLWSKYIVMTKLNLYQSIPVIENIFHITYIHNPGAAFGILANQTTVFIVVTVLVLLGIAFFYKHIKNEGLPVQLALGMVAGGAVGNLIDRIRYGEVVDFLDFRIWPVFNLADTFIVIGVAFLIYDILARPDIDKGEEAK
ncbi:signal peptidase II [Desulfofalx alkaliphila]|uniref:signal peptidase II n=1 Tax=Desulfofalx alkaliphila TaxID=105483 RepID=UPI0004E14641|nr:signal peptidase II [Desulfofalx alkaliphila]